ncbi:hypothetical protein AWM68_02985 [Fictibacillus phosphorivorans]|uniref:Uncharacterized protein n=1 Tax=Fictibacillus phosphorivorans TaxID=1221500 RepID=A0A163SJN1_9BACL|nr:hypothetical protein AWM68_02985 [Fictibacillus phosphorivorans]
MYFTPINYLANNTTNRNEMFQNFPNDNFSLIFVFFEWFTTIGRVNPVFIKQQQKFQTPQAS